jgi:hypothetical protein
MSGTQPAVGERNLDRIVLSIRDLFFGRCNAYGRFTCTTNAASTVVSAPNCGPDSEVMLQAVTANAAAEVGNGTIYISARGQGTFTVVHANSATASRTFAYRIVG